MKGMDDMGENDHDLTGMDGDGLTTDNNVALAFQHEAKLHILMAVWAKKVTRL